MPRSRGWLVAGLLAIVPQLAVADYLEVRRPATIKAAPEPAGAILLHVGVGTNLSLVQEQQTSGYYQVHLPRGGGAGWIYRTLVRRQLGDIPGGPTPTGGLTALGCAVPYASIAASGLTIDATCGAEGSATAQAHKNQNRAKNNLCATGPAGALTVSTFTDLQQAVDGLVDAGAFNYGTSNSISVDRSVLADLTVVDGLQVGEGSLVRFAGFVIDAHYSNVSSGESVNCKLKGRDNNDIHIELATDKDEQDDCNTVTAQIIPHFRPPAWDPTNLEAVKRPLRLSGQLFFDGSHKPCRGGVRASPARISSWEIHPVYGIDVCRQVSLSQCNASDESAWIPLHQWFALEEGHGDDE